VVPRRHFRIEGVVCILIGLIALPFLGASGTVRAQSCTHYLNATDGDDENTGMAASHAVRTLEHAFKSFPSGAVVCTTAGEYFQGADGDGIQLTGPGAVDKSITFMLQSFAGGDVIGITEDEFVVDIGSGTLTFISGSASKLYFGQGIVNNDSDFPDHTNFLHTVRLISGTVDAEAVDLTVGSSTGNPLYEQGVTHAPDSAAIIRGGGLLIGTPQYADAFRRLVYIGAGDRESGNELAGLDRLDLVLAHSEGTITIPHQLSFVEGGIVASGNGSTHFNDVVSFSNPTTTGITTAGSGSLIFDMLSGVFGADLEWIDVQTGTVEVKNLEARLSGDAPAVNVSVINAGELVLHSISTPPLLSGASVSFNLINDGGGSLQLNASDALAVLATGIENRENGTATFSGGHSLVGPIVNDGLVEIDGATTFQNDVVNHGEIIVSPSDAGSIAVTLEGVLENNGSIGLNSNELLLSLGGTHSNPGAISGGTVVLAGDITLSGAGLLPNLEARSGNVTLSDQQIEGGIECRPPSSLHLDQIQTRVNSITVGCNLTHSGPLEIETDLLLESGLFTLADDVSILGDYDQRAGAALHIGSSTLSIGGHFEREGGPFQVDNGEVVFMGNGAQSFDPGPDLQLHHLSTIGPGTEVVAASQVELAGDLMITDSTELTVESGSLRLIGSTSAARIIGRLLTTAAGSLEFAGSSGSVQTVQGGGVVGNLLINMDDENSAVTIVGAGIRQSGTLALERGSLIVAPLAMLVLSDELAQAHIRRNLGDGDSSGSSDGRGIVANTLESGLLDVPVTLNVSYYGIVSDSAAAGAELFAGEIMDLDIDLATHSGARGRIRINQNVLLQGSLTIGAETDVDASGYSIVVRGSEDVHVIDGAITSGELILEGTGELRGSPLQGQWLDELSIESEGVVRMDAAGSISSLNLGEGQLSIGIPQEASVDTYRQDGPETELQLRSPLNIRSRFQVVAGSVVSESFDVIMGSDAEFSISPEATWGSAGTGGLVFIGSGLISGDEAVLPRLKLAGASPDTLRLGAALRVTSILEQESGTLDLAGRTLTLDGQTWAVDTGTFGDTGTILIPGNLQAVFSRDIEVPAIVVGDAAGQGELSISSRDGVPISMSAGTVELRGGVLDLGINDLRLTGSTPLLVSSGGSLRMTSSSSVEPDENGEIVFADSGTIQLDVSLTISNLRLEGGVFLGGLLNKLTVVDQMTFESGTLAGAAGQFILEAGARVVRSGHGAPLITPVLNGPIDLHYATNGTAISGLLLTGSELFDQIRDLVIDGGVGPLGDENTIRLTKDIRVMRRLWLVSGFFDSGDNSITIAGGGEVLIDFRRASPPRFADGTSYQTDGPITLSYVGAGGDLTSDDLTFPGNADIEELVVRMGDGSSQTPRHFGLHSLRTVERLVVNHLTEDSSFDLNGTTLTVDSTAHIAAGRVTATTEGLLDVGSDFLVDANGSADGVLAVSVDGRTVIDGMFRGHVLQAYGDVTVAGSLGGPDRNLDANANGYVPGLPNLIFSGRNQALDLSPAEGEPSRSHDSINRLTVALDSTAETTGGALVTVISDHEEGVVLGVNHIEFVNGLVSTGTNVLLLPSNGNGFSRAGAGAVGHVSGSVRREIDPAQPNLSEMTNGRFIFPVGSDYPHAVYRPAAVMFVEDTPSLNAFDITISHGNVPPGGLRGFPINGGENILIDDTAPFHWVIQSSVDFPPGRAYTLEFLATDFTQFTSIGNTRLIRRGMEPSSRWRLHANPTDYDNARTNQDGLPAVFVQTRATTDGLSAEPTFFTIGLEPDAIDFSRVQFIHNALANIVEVGLDGDTIYTGLEPQEATEFLRLSPGEHELHFEHDGNEIIRESVSFEPGSDYIVVASGADGELSEGFYIHEDARATTDESVENDAQISLFNGYSSPLSITFARGTPAEVSVTGIGSAGFLDEYITVPPDLLRFDLLSANHSVSHRTDLRPLEGLTAIIIASPDNEEALVYSSEGERLASSTVVSEEQSTQLPDQFMLRGNFPNPFNPTTQITFDLPDAASVRVEIFDIVGRRVVIVDGGRVAAGANRHIEVDAGHLPSGVYLYRIIAKAAASRHTGSGTFTLIK